MTVGALGEQMSASEMVEWSVFFELEHEEHKSKKEET